MFKKPFTALKKFFTFKLPGKKGVVLPSKTNLKPKSQEQVAYEERMAKMLRRTKFRTHTKLMQTQLKVKRWRQRGQSGIKAGLRPGHEAMRDRETNRLRAINRQRKLAAA